MNRNGVVFIPREQPKRVILYPQQDSVNQQQLNGIYQRAQTELFISHHSETIAQSSNNSRPLRQQPLSSLPNGTLKFNDKSSNDGTVPTSSGHLTALSVGHRVQNPYYANPFFRPRVITSQQPGTNTSVSSASSAATTDVTSAAIVPSSLSSTMPNRGKLSLYPRIQSPLLFSNGKPSDNTTTALTSPPQDDNRPWAQPVVSTHIVRYNANNERSNGPPKASEINATNNDTLKQKGSSATDIVISLMDTSSVSHNSGSASAVNAPTRSNGARDDSTTNGHVFSSSEQLPSTPPFSLVDISSTANNNNQNWKKALVANFQKNHRNVPTAKLFYSKQHTAPLQTSVTLRPITPLQTAAPSNNDIVNQQQQQQLHQHQLKPKQSIAINNSLNEGPTQADENAAPVPNSAGRSSESLLIPKQETSSIERSASQQIPKFTYSQPTTNNTDVTSNSNAAPYNPISIPSALLMSKPPANIEQQQQRANITRVMIRRDFVKPFEWKPPMPAASTARPPIPPQSTKSDTLPTNNIIRVATITESSNRTYSSQQQSQQQQQTVHLSQKSLLPFTSSNSTTKETIKTDSNQQKSSSTMRARPSQSTVNNGATSSDEAKRRRREEIDSMTKRRAASASAASDYE